MQLFHNTFAMEDSAIVAITRKLVNAYQVPQLDMIVIKLSYLSLEPYLLIEKLKSIMQIFCLKIGPPFPLQSMEMEDQFSNQFQVMVSL